MHDGNRPPASDQTDHLNEFLDAVVRGRLAPRGGFDSGLAAAVRQVHGLPEEFGTPDVALKRQVWEDIMHASAHSLQPTPSGQLAPATPLGPTGPEASNPVRVLPEVATPRWRGFVGGFATAALVLLVAVSALGVKQFAPGSGSDDPTELPAMAPSPSAERAEDAVQPVIVECTVEPRTLDEMQLLLDANVIGTLPAVPTPFVTDPNDAGNGRGLPDGPTPDSETISRVVAAYGEYFGCFFTDDPLRTSAMQSDAMVIRAYYHSDGVPIIGQIMRISRTPDPERFRGAAEVGEPAPGSLSGFRMIDEDRVGAYVSSSSDGTPNGYIVFVRVDGRWLIDDLIVFRG